MDRDAVAHSMRPRHWLAVGMSAYDEVSIAATTPPSQLSLATPRPVRHCRIWAELDKDRGALQTETGAKW